ncbi:MAG TPA: RHS repeat-associated core domain-containing protein, partial [Chloroflexota bacterium]|nr:RHS repeat-associated core domain-containing protein [Chloroflexota bacterium]
PTTLLIKQPYRIQHTTRKDAGGTAFARYQSSWRFYDGLGRLIQTQEDFSRSGMVIHAQDLNGLSAASGAGFTVSAGTSLIKATDFTTVRTKIGTLWGSAHLGSVPSWTSGVTPSGPPSATPIYASDLVDLRNWLNLYQDATNTTRTAWTNGAGSVLVVNKFYDARGCLANESVPHTLNVTVPGRFAGSDVDWSVGAHPTTASTYDALKRPKTKVQPDGQATFHWDYAGLQTTTTDENGHQKTSTTDALGRTVQVQEKVNGNWSTTGYQYDIADRLIQVTDALGNQTTIGYDSLGRKIAMSDPDLGANWSYVYGDSPTLHNPIWLVASQTDPKNQTISYQYDRLDRLTNKTGSNLAVTYSYDDQSGGNCGVGRKTSLQDGAGSASYVYDKRGRLTSLSRTINLQTYQLTTSYDAQDRPLEISFPNGDVLTYTYGDHGKATFLVLNDSVPLVSNATYNALKKVTTLPLENGLPTNWKYFGIDQQATVSNRWFGLPYRVRTGPLQNQVFDPASGYDLVGNPTTLSYIDHANETLSFAYNELDQLVSTSGAVSESYGTYLQGSADLGNLLSSREGTYSYPSAGQPRPHAPTAVSNIGSYQYDANGNRQSDPTFGYTFDVENHLTKVTQGGTVVLRNTFDGDGNRLVRVVSGTKTHYVGDWYEFDPDTGLATVYYPFNGQAVAMKQGETLYYLHRDQVGSVVAVSDDSGNEVGTARYWPFGGLRLSTGLLPTDRLFTGQIRDLGDDRFYFFKARYYDATIGKFVQPDTIVPDAKNPQALNRYAYGLNNPLKFVDPSGHDSATDDRNEDLRQINSKDWSVRLQWLQEFVKIHKLGGWFNDIEGAISYFAHSPNLQHNAALLDADAKVLTAVRDGWAGYRNGDAGHDRAAAAWATFFGDYTVVTAIGNPVPQEVFRLKQLRYNAEQAGVDWAVNQGLSATYGRDESGFVAAGFVWGANGYRWLGGNSALGAILPGGVSVADPRNPPPEYALVAQAGEFAIGYTWGLYTRPTLFSLLGGE